MSDDEILDLIQLQDMAAAERCPCGEPELPHASGDHRAMIDLDWSTADRQCAAGRTVTHPDLPGWQHPCPKRTYSALYVSGRPHDMCPDHLEDLERRGLAE